MDRPASQYTLVSYLITLLPLLFRWSNTGFSGVTVHPADVVVALAAPATASGIARAASPVRASAALRENDTGTPSIFGPAPVADPQPHLRVHPASRFSAPCEPGPKAVRRWRAGSPLRRAGPWLRMRPQPSTCRAAKHRIAVIVISRQLPGRLKMAGCSVPSAGSASTQPENSWITRLTLVSECS